MATYDKATEQRWVGRIQTRLHPLIESMLPQECPAEVTGGVAAGLIEFGIIMLAYRRGVPLAGFEADAVATELTEKVIRYIESEVDAIAMERN